MKWNKSLSGVSGFEPQIEGTLVLYMQEYMMEENRSDGQMNIKWQI